MNYPARVLLFQGNCDNLTVPINTNDFSSGSWYLRLDSLGVSNASSSCFVKITCNFVTETYSNFQGNYSISRQILSSPLIHPIASGLAYMVFPSKYYKINNITNFIQLRVECLDGSLLKEGHYTIQVSLYKL